MKRTVALFGLSADPPTGLGGHAGIVRWLAKQPELDEVWVIPVFRHAFTEKSSMVPFEHRLRMAELAFSSLPGARIPVRVLDVERLLADRVSGTVGTIDVVRHLMTHQSGHQFVLVLGGDTHRDLMAGRWKESERLRSLVEVWPVVRPGVGEGVLNVEKAGPALEAVSSSALRRSRDRDLWASVVQPQVLDYIRQHRLYGFSDGE